MTDEGKTILSAIHQIRDLHRSISRLLKTADAAMDVQGWKNAKADSTALHEMSYSIDRPERWMPWDVYRYYKHTDHPSILASITVILDDSEGRLSEPLVSGGLFDFGQGQTVANFYTWLSSIYKAVPDREADGRFREISRAQLEPSWQTDFEKAWCFAIPLVEMASEAVLREDVVEKLLSKLPEIMG